MPKVTKGVTKWKKPLSGLGGGDFNGRVSGLAVGGTDKAAANAAINLQYTDKDVQAPGPGHYEVAGVKDIGPQYK